MHRSRSESGVEEATPELESDVEDDDAVEISGESETAFLLISLRALDSDLHWNCLFSSLS